MADYRDQLEDILEICRLLGSTDDEVEVNRAVADCMRDLLDAERATVFAWDADSNTLRAVAGHGPTGEHMEDLGDIVVELGTGLAGTAGASREIINIPDAYADDRFYRGVDEKTGYRTRSILTIPLVTHDDDALVGVAQVLNRKDGPFTARDESVASALAAQSAVVMRRSRLLSARVRLLQVQRDLDIARGIQAATFPTEFPEFDGWSIHGWSMPAEETGGDAFDAVAVSGGAVMMLGDATGHGIGPAISVTQARSMLRMALRLDAPLPDLVDHLNQQLWQDTSPAQFITAWFGRLDAASGVVTSISCGQGPILLLHGDGSLDEIDADAPPLGVLDTLNYDAPQEIQMHPGDLLVVPSDGIIEAMADDGSMYEQDRLVEVLRAGIDLPLADLLESVRDDIEAYRGEGHAQDDRTIIALKRHL